MDGEDIMNLDEASEKVARLDTDMDDLKRHWLMELHRLQALTNAMMMGMGTLIVIAFLVGVMI